MCFVDVKQPITRLELPELYERLTTWATDTTKDLIEKKALPSGTQVPRWQLTKQEAIEAVSHLDLDCALYDDTIRHLLDVQLRYESMQRNDGTYFIIDSVLGHHTKQVQQEFRNSVRCRLLTAWVIVAAVQLEFLLLLAREAKEKNLSGRELLDFWASIGRQRR